MKVLIYFEEKLLKPVGGPAGYLYNVKSELDKRNNNDISFLNIKESFAKKIYNNLPAKIKNSLKKNIKKENQIVIDVLYKQNHNSPIDLNNYDIVHFHSSMSMYSVKDSLENYRGCVLFTTHTPKISYKEIIEDLTPKDVYEKYKSDYDKLDIIDEYAFNRADFILFPAEEAEECYYNTWDKYSNIKEKNKDKYIYLPTGIKKFEIENNSSEVRKKYNIPDDAFVVSYVGRHNEVKGYDQLKEIASEVLKKDKNIYFLIAGKEEPIKGLEHDHWIEVGWTNNPHEIINCSYMFVLPNKETYFDLILLEVLCIGKNILMTNTGGNKFFKKFNNSGLYYYDYGNIKEATDNIIKIKDTNKEILLKQQRDVIKLFEQNFTIEIFCDKYLEIINGVLKCKRK